MPKPSATIGEAAKTNARMSADPLAAAGASGGVITSANPPRTARASCCVKNERPRRFLGRGRFRFPPVRPTPRNPVRSVRASPPGPSQEPLDGRNLATLGFLGPRRAAGWMALDSGDGLSDFRGRLRSGSVRTGVLPRTSSGRLSLNGPGAWKGSLAQSRGALSILRSTSDRPIDERRCRRNESPSCPRAKRGAPARSRARSDRSPTCSTIRASSR